MCNFVTNMNIEDNKTTVNLGERTLVTQDKGTELFPEIDADGNVIGSMSRKEAHDGSKRLHAVVHLHLFNSKGELYLQHRAAWKDIQPDKWDTATGGHIDLGETMGEALAREVYEELGILPDAYEARLVKKYIYESDREREMVYVHTATYDGEVHPSDTETSGGRFWSMQEIRDNIGKQVFTPMFEAEIQKII